MLGLQTKLLEKRNKAWAVRSDLTSSEPRGAAQELKGDAQKATGDAKNAIKEAANKTASAVKKKL